MTLSHISDLIWGLLAVGAGVHSIATKRVTFSSDDDEEQTWLYGWRAVAIGVMVLVIGVAMMAGGLGVAFFDGL